MEVPRAISTSNNGTDEYRISAASSSNMDSSRDSNSSNLFKLEPIDDSSSSNQSGTDRPSLKSLYSVPEEFSMSFRDNSKYERFSFRSSRGSAKQPDVADLEIEEGVIGDSDGDIDNGNAAWEANTNNIGALPGNEIQNSQGDETDCGDSRYSDQYPNRQQTVAESSSSFDDFALRKRPPENYLAMEEKKNDSSSSSWADDAGSAGGVGSGRGRNMAMDLYNQNQHDRRTERMKNFDSHVSSAGESSSLSQPLVVMSPDPSALNTIAAFSTTSPRSSSYLPQYSTEMLQLLYSTRSEAIKKSNHEPDPENAKSSLALIKLKAWDPAIPPISPMNRIKSEMQQQSSLGKFLTISAAVHLNAFNSMTHFCTNKIERDNLNGDNFDSNNVAGGADTDVGPSSRASCDDNNGRIKSIGSIFSSDASPETDKKQQSSVKVGALIGIQLDLQSSLAASNASTAKHRQLSHSVGTNTSISSLASSGSTTTGGYSAYQHHFQRTFDWKVGDTVHVHKLHLLPSNGWPELFHQIKDNIYSLRELILDGLPPQTMSFEEASVIIEAIGGNTSIKRCSMRFSCVDDEIASLFALALVDNTMLTQLLLEGNKLTNTAVKNFYSVLKKNNVTLRLLDISKNPMVDQEVEDALNQFMEQRALKRTLRNKAEKAKRAAKGMPPDSGEEEEDEVNPISRLNCVTVVCHPSIISGDVSEAYDGDGEIDNGDYFMTRSSSVNSVGPSIHIGNASKTSDITSLEDQTLDADTYDNTTQDDTIASNLDEDGKILNQMLSSSQRNYEKVKQQSNKNSSVMNGPCREERFQDYMQRMESVKAAQQQSLSYNENLLDQSESDRAAFENYPILESSHPAQPRSPVKTADLQKQQQLINAPTIQNQKQHYEPDFQELQNYKLSSNRDFNYSMGSSITSRSGDLGSPSDQTPPPLENHEAVTSIDVMPASSISAAAREGISNTDMAPFRAAAIDKNHNDAQQSSLFTTDQVAHQKGWLRPRDTNGTSFQSSANTTINSALDLTDQDYMDDKAGEAEFRRQLATSGVIGAYQVNEPAPSRQGRRARVRRTESQRRARLAALTGGNDVNIGTSENVVAGVNAENRAHAINEAQADQTVMDAHIERYDDHFGTSSQYSKDDEDYNVDKIICAVMSLLVIGLLVLVILLMT